MDTIALLRRVEPHRFAQYGPRWRATPTERLRLAVMALLCRVRAWDVSYAHHGLRAKGWVKHDGTMYVTRVDWWPTEWSREEVFEKGAPGGSDG